MMKRIDCERGGRLDSALQWLRMLLMFAVLMGVLGLSMLHWFHDAIAAFNLACGALLALATLIAPRGRTLRGWLLLGNFAWVLLTRALATGIAGMPIRAAAFAALMFGFYAGAAGLDRPRRALFLNAVTVALCGVMLAWAAVAIPVALTGRTVAGIDRILIVTENADPPLRYVSLFGLHRNISAAYYVIAAGLAIRLGWLSRRRWVKALAAGFVLVSYIMVALQMSRSNGLAMAFLLSAACAIWLCDALKKRQAWLRIGASILLLAIGTGLLYAGLDVCKKGVRQLSGGEAAVADEADSREAADGPGAMPVTVSDGRDTWAEAHTLNGRLEIWTAGLCALAERPIMALVGESEARMMDAVNRVIGWRSVRHMHNVQMQQLMLAGIPGLLMYILFFGSLIAGIAGGFRRFDRERRLLSALMVGLMFYGVFEPLMSDKIPMASLVFCMLAGCNDADCD